jgi:membrane protein required for colicin V production
MLLNNIDIALLTIAVLSALLGLWRGLVKETIALLTWILAIFLALEWQDEVIELLPQMSSTAVKSVLAFGIIFATVFILGLILRFLIRWLIASSGFGIVDRILGGFFGILRGLLIGAVLITVGELIPYTKALEWPESMIAEKLSPVTHWMQTYFHFDENMPEMTSGMFSTNIF